MWHPCTACFLWATSEHCPCRLLILLHKQKQNFFTFGPPWLIIDREVHFFDRYYANGKEWYREQMPKSTLAQITMEKTPGYFIHPMAPMRIKAFDPNVKVRVASYSEYCPGVCDDCAISSNIKLR